MLRLPSTLRRSQLICYLVTSELPCSSAHAKVTALPCLVVGQTHWTIMTSRTTHSTSTPMKPTLFSGHYFRNRSTLDISVLGYIGILQNKEHPPLVWHVTPGTPVYRVYQKERARLREGVTYVKVYRYNPKHLCPKLNGYGNNGQRVVCSSCGSTHCTCLLTILSISDFECGIICREFRPRYPINLHCKCSASYRCFVSGW